MPNNKRMLAFALAGALLTGGLVGCSSSGGDSDVTTIRWWARVGEGQQQLVQQFNATHDDIQVDLTQIPDDQYVNKVGTGIRGSNGPDVLDFDVANAPLFAATGVLADITDRVEALGFADALNPGMARLGEYDGTTYSVPFNAGPSFILYNKTLFEQAGLDPEAPPETWEEITEAATAVSELDGDTYGFDVPGACGGALAFTVQPFIWASGGTTMTEPGPDQETTYAESPEVASTFEFYRGLWESGAVPQRAQTTDCATWGQEWEAGRVGMIVAGAWKIAPLEETGDEVGYFAIPGRNGGTSTFAGGNNTGVTASSRNQDAAWEFVTWLLDEEAQLAMAEANGQAPARSDLLSDEYTQEHPLAAFQTEIGEVSDGPNSIATNALQLSASSPWLSAFQRVVFEGADPESALREADSESRELIEQAYAQVVQ